EQTTQYVYEKAVSKLMEMDAYLKEHGFLHLIFISPTKDQVIGDAGKHEFVQDLMNRYELNPIYILDKIENYNLSETELEELYRDPLHLDKKGHELWAQIIKSELIEKL